jgi:hypothetical protein
LRWTAEELLDGEGVARDSCEETLRCKDVKLRLGVRRGGELLPGATVEEPEPATRCCISTLALLELSLRRSDVRLFFSASRFGRRCLLMLLLASLLCEGFLLRPPVLMDVFSKGVALMFTLSPPDNMNCNT